MDNSNDVFSKHREDDEQGFFLQSEEAVINQPVSIGVMIHRAKALQDELDKYQYLYDQSGNTEYVAEYTQALDNYMRYLNKQYLPLEQKL